MATMFYPKLQITSELKCASPLRKFRTIAHR
jgi:hypothetical protein